MWHDAESASQSQPKVQFARTLGDTMLIPWTLVVASVAAAAAQTLDLYEGDVCKQQNGALWTCKLMKDCPKNQEKLKKGQRSDVCNFKGSDVITCCEPEVKPQAVGLKSKEMCKKYGESVYVKVPDPSSNGNEYFSLDTCAAVESLITNIVSAGSREFPHMALIGYGDKDSIEWLCEGSLISERFVLSTARCTDAGEIGMAKWARLGVHEIKSKLEDNTGFSQPEEYEIIERINHPEFIKSSVYNDITLFKLNKNVEFNEYIRPICLQTEHQFPNSYAIATGWGLTEWGGERSNFLQKVNLTITPRKSCSDSYKAALGEKLRYGIIDTTMMCVQDTRDTTMGCAIINGKNICKAVFGRPLQTRLADPYCMYSQIGINSFGAQSARRNLGVYTRVSAFVPWIESVVWK